ncbi:MAG TPA: HD domain-containing protein [Candidatus Limnocylindrales bacterium]|nr:HD domain-containing protein [Candidatus Limnocylindrales bacterium]
MSDQLPPARRPAFAAINLVSDPIHGYLELTKPLTGDEAVVLGLPDESATEVDLLDSAWVQRLRRISQLQSARWVFPTAEHSRFTHGLGVMHEAGLWGGALHSSLVAALRSAEPDAAVPSEGLVVETLRVAGLLHDVGHGPFAHFFDDHVLADFAAPPDARRPDAKALTHEDLSQLIVLRELGRTIRALRRAPLAAPERARFGDGEAIDPAWVAFLISKPAIDDPAMPRWVRWLQPLLSGVFTVDNLDYVRRDAYMTGVATAPVDPDRLRRYAFMTPDGLTLHESGVGALEQFLLTRLYLYEHVYLHRTVRAIDIDLGEVFAPSIRALFGEGSPADRLGDYADLDEYALLHQAAMWARGEHLSARPRPGDGTVEPAIGETWRRILLRRPRWRVEREVRAESESGTWPEEVLEALGSPEPGRAVVDLAAVDARRARPGADGRLRIERRDGTPGPAASDALRRVPRVALVGRRYRRVG